MICCCSGLAIYIYIYIDTYNTHIHIYIYILYTYIIHIRTLYRRTLSNLNRPKITHLYNSVFLKKSWVRGVLYMPLLTERWRLMISKNICKFQPCLLARCPQCWQSQSIQDMRQEKKEAWENLEPRNNHINQIHQINQINQINLNPMNVANPGCHKPTITGDGWNPLGPYWDGARWRLSLVVLSPSTSQGLMVIYIPTI